MRRDWVRKTIGEIALVKGGKRVPKGYKLLLTPTPYPYITVSDFNDDGTVDTANLKYINKDVHTLIKRYTISSEDLYLSIAGTIGKTGFVPAVFDGANLTENACKLVLHDGVDKKFVYYFTKSNSFIEQAGINTRVAAQPKLALSRLKTISLPLPPLPEQKRIVAILDEAFAAIATATANAEKNLANARELFESYLNMIFSTIRAELVRVEEACDSIIDCINKTAPQIDYETPYRMIRTTNVRDGVIGLDRVHYVTEETYRLWTRRQVPKTGDVILTREAPMGEVGMLESDDGVFLRQRLVSYRAYYKKLLPKFLLYAFRSKLLQDQIRTLGSGSTVQHMRVPDTKRLQIPLPPLSEQSSIVGALAAIESRSQQLLATYCNKVTALTKLKQSILHKAFTGELTTDTKATDRRLSQAGL